MLSEKEFQILVEKIRAGKATLSEKLMVNKFLDLHKVSTFKGFVLAFKFPIDWQWFHFFLMDKVDSMLVSDYSRRIIVEMPPRHCKTLLLGQLLLVYVFGRYPDKVSIYATANEPKAEEETSNIRGLLNSDEYRNIFPNAQIKSGMEDVSEIDRRVRKDRKDTAKILSNVNSKRGKIVSVGRGTMLTGYPSHLSIADDLYKDSKEAQSPVIRKTISNWFHSVFVNRADKTTEKSTVHIIMFFTRWHSDDLCGELMHTQQMGPSEEYIQEWEEKNKQKWLRWELYSFQALKTERDYKLTESKILGQLEVSMADPREIGEPLWPKYAPEYAQIRLQSPEIFEAQYQQTPPDEFGLLFTKQDFQFYSELPKNITRISICVDASFKNTMTSDHVGIAILGMVGNSYIYLIEFLKLKANYTLLKSTVTEFIRKYNTYYAIVIEEAANGVALIDDLKINYPRVIGFNPHSKSKKEKAQLALPTFTAGNFYVPSTKLNPKILEYIQQFTSFTGEPGNEDDLVDATVIGVLFFNAMRFSVGVDAIRTCSNPTMNRLQITETAKKRRAFFNSHSSQFR